MAASTSNALTDVPVPCNPSDQTYVGQQFKLVQQSGARKAGGGGSMTVSGTLTVVDGCTFTVSDFVPFFLFFDDADITFTHAASIDLFSTSWSTLLVRYLRQGQHQHLAS